MFSVINLARLWNAAYVAGAGYLASTKDLTPTWRGLLVAIAGAVVMNWTVQEHATERSATAAAASIQRVPALPAAPAMPTEGDVAAIFDHVMGLAPASGLPRTAVPSTRPAGTPAPPGL